MSALSPGLRTALLTLLAMLAFASNSLLCRVALTETSIDAASFTSLRLASGALILLAHPATARRRRDGGRKLADGGHAVGLCGVLLLRLPRPHRRDRRAAAVRRRAAHHDGLRPVGRRTPPRRETAGRGGGGGGPDRPAAAGPRGTAAARRPADAGGGRGLGRLFPARPRRRRSDRRDRRQFPARRALRRAARPGRDGGHESVDRMGALYAVAVGRA